MLFVREMSNGGRVKVNEFEVYEATTTINGEVNTSEFSDTGAIVDWILTNEVGIDAGKVSVVDATPFLSWTTAKAKALDLLNDLGKKTNCVLICELDGSLVWKADPLYPTRTLPDIAMEFGKESIVQPQFERGYGQDVSQVIVHARDAVSGTMFTGQYPPAEATFGSPLVLEEIVLGSAQEAQMLAEMVYRQARNPLTGRWEMVGTGENVDEELPLIAPGSRVLVTWNLDETGSEYFQRNFSVDGCHLSASFGGPGQGGKSWDVSLSVREFLF
jgi:hypothetical protein